jgi:arylsulfatase A-like enzyme
VADRALLELDQVGDRPFFLFLHFFDVHGEYVPPEQTRALFPSPYRGPLLGRWREYKDRAREELPAGYLEHLLSLYDGEIRFVDDQIGRVLDHMHARGLDRSTLVLVTSDHGEAFLDHDAWGHGRSLHEEVIRIPMILRGPGVRRGREAGQVSLLDVMPTLLEWAGLPVPPRAQGHSLLRPVGARAAFGDKGHAKGGARKLFLRGGQGGYKLILSLDPVADRVIREEWYDLGSDPGERRQAPPAPEEAEALRRKALARWRAAHGQGGEGVGVTLSEQEIEQLRALGYLGT